MVSAAGGRGCPAFRARLLAVTLARNDRRAEGARALVGIGLPDIRPVHLSDAGRPDPVFDQVVIEATFAVMQMDAEISPLAE